EGHRAASAGRASGFRRAGVIAYTASSEGGLNMKVRARLLVIGLITSAFRIPLAILLASTTVRAEESGSQRAPAGLAVMQMSGRAFQEGLQAGDRDQARLFIWSLEGPDQSILGPDVPLFEPGCVAKFSEGVQCAY